MASYESLEKRVTVLEEKEAKKPRSGKITVPLPCQASVRNVLTTCMGEGLTLTLISKKDDQEAMLKVVRETRRLYSDAGWGQGTCEVAFWKKWKNRRDEKTRVDTGKKEQHRESAKRNKRINDKLKSRLKAIETIEWSERRKAKVLPLLKKELTSPLKTDPEDDNGLLSTPLSWASNKLNKSKASLDEVRNFSGTPVQRQRRKLWRRHPSEVTVQATPPGLPDWAVAEETED